MVEVMNLNSLKRSLDEMAIDDGIESMVECFDRILLAPKRRRKIVEIFTCNTCCVDYQNRCEVDVCACGSWICNECLSDTCGVCTRCNACCTGTACVRCETNICSVKGEEYSCDECGDIYCEDCSFGWFLWYGNTCFACMDEWDSEESC